MRYRHDFEYQAQCGFWVCSNCDRVWYPIELDEEDTCPECGFDCRHGTMDEVRGVVWDDSAVCWAH